MTKPVDYKAEFKGFCQTAEDAEWYPAIAVLTDASTNANETECAGGGFLQEDTAEWYEAAYRSICETGDFNEKTAIRNFFKALGYEW